MFIKSVSPISFRADNIQNPNEPPRSPKNTTPIDNSADMNYVNTSPNSTQTPFKNGIANIAKLFVVTGEMTKGIIKAVLYGFLTGTVIAGWKWTTKALPKAFTKEGSIKETFNHPARSIGWKANLLAGTAALGVAAYHIVRARLKSNQGTANVDHQLYTGHRDI